MSAIIKSENGPSETWNLLAAVPLDQSHRHSPTDSKAGVKSEAEEPRVAELPALKRHRDASLHSLTDLKAGVNSEAEEPGLEESPSLRRHCDASPHSLADLEAGAEIEAKEIKRDPRLFSKSLYAFREGEMVWYMATKVWRLGFVIRSDHMSPDYLVIPIPFHSTRPVEVSQGHIRVFREHPLKPTSTPECEGKCFDSVQWEDLFRQFSRDEAKFNRLSQDAVILAARKIFQSISFYHAMPWICSPPMIVGCFLGAEHIQRGDLLECIRRRRHHNTLCWRP